MFKRTVTLLATFALAFALTPVISGGLAFADQTASDEDAPFQGMGVASEEGAAGADDLTRRPGALSGMSSQKIQPERENSWTIFVYMCATDLESDGGMATNDISEMLTTNGEDVRYVIECGGTRRWNNNTMDARKLQRYVIEDGSISRLSSAQLANMGDSNTLAEFLAWGTATYPAEHQGLVMWDHGGGSVVGVCCDQNYNFNALTLNELEAALNAAVGTESKTFEFIGFDACLMGSLETANVLAPYANYMYGSEEVEPGRGWDYEGISEYLNANPQADGAELGKVVCDTYYAANAKGQYGNLVTLSVIDLSKIGDVVTNFHTLSEELCQVGADSGDLGSIVRGIGGVDHFGSNNRSEGYTNMVDLGGLVDACGPYVNSEDEVTKAIDEAVVYNAVNTTHKDASGLSVYYPLSTRNSSELKQFEGVCVSPNYLSFVSSIQCAGVTGAPVTGGGPSQMNSIFDLGQWLWEGLGLSTTEPEPQPEPTPEPQPAPQPESEPEPEQPAPEQQVDTTGLVGASQFVTFAQPPALDENGNYTFTLDQNGINNSSNVTACVYEAWEDGSLVELGQTIDVYGDWTSGKFFDGFDGKWLALPDGQCLATYFVGWDGAYAIYTSPILLDGKMTNLRMRQHVESRQVQVEGAWAGIDENGMAAREVVPIEAGNAIIPLYYGYNNAEAASFVGDRYVVDASFAIKYSTLPGEKYWYAFVIDDIYGGCLITEPVEFYVLPDGSVGYYG